jgi:alkaline phosphatase
MAGVASLAQAAGPNIIVFIGDGMGFEHVQAGRLYKNGNDATPLSFEQLAYRGQAVTKLPNGTATDSATAGTALATGYQHPANGVISMGANNSIKTSILELAKARGLRTGIITTDSISGATPGAFGAHEPDRTFEADIRYDYLMADTTYNHAASQPNVLFGGGYDDPYVIPGPNATYSAIATSLGYTFVKSATELAMLPTTDRALGLFGTGWLPMDSYVANNPAQPRLPVMVNKALSLLQNNNGAGFFLMVEGALIDKLSHSNDRNFVPEVAQLDLAVQEAFAWASQTGQPLLVIVTADHETGGVNVPDGQVITPGNLPNLTFSSTGHTVNNVPVYGNWPATLQNQTIDNTEVFFLVEDYLESGKPPVITDLVVNNITETSATVQWNTVEPSDSQAVLSGIASPFTDSARVTAHALVCTGLQPGTTCTLAASSTDLAGFSSTNTIQFTTLAAQINAVATANPAVTLGTLAGNFIAVNALNDGLTQTITEVTSGNGSRLQAEYTLHTTVPRAEITKLDLYGAVAWTQNDGVSDSLVTEVRVAAPGGGYAWERITLSAAAPFAAEPPSSYVDASGNVVLRFTDSAAIKRERKDTLTVDYLVGVVERSQQPPPAPTAPANLVAIAAGSASVTLTWTDSSNETGYDIWRYTTAAGWVFVGSANANATACNDVGLQPATQYSYVVRAYNSQSYADSEAVSATTGAPELEMPENLAARAGKGVVNLTWTDTNTGETAYQVLRAEGEGTAIVLATLAANATAYADTAVTKGVTYKFQVRAMLGTTPGPATSPVSATPR